MDRDKDKTDDKQKVHTASSSHRGTRYKEKFQALREKYDQVITVHEDHQRDLAIASAKMKKLQAENDLLLDAIYVGQPHLLQYLQQQQTLCEPPPYPAAVPDHAPRTRPSPLPTPAPNGNSNGATNGLSRHRYTEPQPLDDLQRELTNGRMS